MKSPPPAVPSWQHVAGLTGRIQELAQMVRAGLPYKTLARFQEESELTMDSIALVMQIPRRTMARRKVQGRLTPQESERMVRLLVIYDKAVQLFEGNMPAARTWLSTPTKSLSNQTPLRAAETEFGARAVEDLIGRLEHGVFC